jgi:large subunit ribosomal protein L10
VARTEKATNIADIREMLGTAKGAVLTDFRGMSVAEMTELRSLLRKSAVEYRVVKNTLAKKAIQEIGLADLAPYFEGPTAIAVSPTDPVAASKALATWGRGRPAFTVKGGVIEGRVVGPAELAGLAELPSREVLIGRLAGTLQAPIQAFAQVLAATMGGLARALEQVRQKKEGAA